MSAPQHMVALEKANDTRLKRAEFKREIKANDRALLRALDDPPYFIMTASISELLAAQTRWGVTRSRKFLRNLGNYGIPETKKIEDLTRRQRELIIDGLERLRA